MQSEIHLNCQNASEQHKCSSAARIEIFEEAVLAAEKQFCFVAFLTEILTDHFEGSLPLHLPQLSQRQNPLYRNVLDPTSLFDPKIPR